MSKAPNWREYGMREAKPHWMPDDLCIAKLLRCTSADEAPALRQIADLHTAAHKGEHIAAVSALNLAANALTQTFVDASTGKPPNAVVLKALEYLHTGLHQWANKGLKLERALGIELETGRPLVPPSVAWRRANKTVIQVQERLHELLTIKPNATLLDAMKDVAQFSDVNLKTIQRDVKKIAPWLLDKNP